MLEVKEKMGEIRSTLDIIMEKAKGFDISEEERKSLKKKDLESKVRGLLQRLLEGLIRWEDFCQDISRLSESQPELMKTLLKDECLRLLGSQGDEDIVMKVMEDVLRLDVSPIRELVSQFKKRIDKERKLKEMGMLESLAKKGISGTAIIPNLNADPSWNKYVSTHKKEMEGQLLSMASQF